MKELWNVSSSPHVRAYAGTQNLMFDVALALMPAAAFGVYHGLMLLIPVSRAVLLLAIGVGACVYFAVLLLIGGVSEEELLAFPKGYLLVRLAHKLHLLPDGKRAKRIKKKKKRKRRKKSRRR